MLRLNVKNSIVLLDDEDYDLVIAQGAWHINNKGYVHRFTSHGYINGRQQTKVMLLHRLIMNAPKDTEIDHKDGNPLNNQKSNLRISTHHQNMMNRKKQKNNKSGYIGVRWIESRKKWKAAIVLNKKENHIGYFVDLQEAVRARDAKAIELHGEFAKLNGAI